MASRHLLLVLWPLLTPLGRFYANVDAGDIDLLWASIFGFLDVADVMIIVIAHRHERRSARDAVSAPTTDHTRASIVA